ncbi:MAG: M23 family metallopeptidase [Chloroflexota bacterium]
MRRAICLLALLVLVAAPPAAAQGPVAGQPDYAVLERLGLPWACGEGHRISWDPAGHWLKGKARGIAYDLAMPEGTALFAPANGRAYFLLDERPFETNYGNYVEIVTADGGWLIRLAHLRDEQSGERPVRAGEPIGHAGASGVAVAHLHLELLVRSPGGWVRPDLGQIERLFGRPLAELAEGAILSNDGCPPAVALAGPVAAPQPVIPLGAAGQLLVPVRNEGLEPLDLRTVQVHLRSSEGEGLVGEWVGQGTVAAKAVLPVPVTVRPGADGDWQVTSVVYESDAGSGRLAAAGGLRVAPAPLAVAAIETASSILGVGGVITIGLRVQHLGGEPLAYDDLVAQGTRPDGTPWMARLGQAGAIAPGAPLAVTLLSSHVPQQVGLWRVLRVGYQREGQTYYFARASHAFAVLGPELAVRDLRAYRTERGWSVLLDLVNIGTSTASPESIELWGWGADGETPFSVQRRHPAPIAPGMAALIQVHIPADSPEGAWRLAEAGYWLKAAYYPMHLPQPLELTPLPTAPAAE